MVQVNGHAVHLQIVTPSPRPSGPTLVFESGLGDAGRTWDKVIAARPGGLPIVSYDRPGLGSSEDDRETPTPRHVVSVLHNALQQVHAAPPYILIGHSFGAPRVRMFAAMYPSEVAGLVFVDPTDYSVSRDENLRDVWARLGLGVKERDEFDRLTLEQMKDVPETIHRELDVALQAAQSDFGEFRQLPPLPDIPLVVLIASQRPPAGMTASFDLAAWFRLTVETRVTSLTRLAGAVRRSEVVVTSNPDHGLHRSDPALVVWAIERVIHLLP